MDALALERRQDLEPALDNPRGFFESRQLVAFNDDLLEAVGADWSRPPLLAPRWSEGALLARIAAARDQFQTYALSTHWVEKDPRLCLTLPATLHLLLKRAPVIAVLRAPLDVAMSLHHRNGMEPERGLALWFLYNHHLSRALQQDDALVSYSQMLAMASCDRDLESHPVLHTLNLFLEHHGHGRPALSQWQSIIAARVEPTLNRSTAQQGLVLAWQDRLPSRLLKTVETAYHRSLAGLAEFQDAFSGLPLPLLELLERYPICAVGEHAAEDRRRLGEALAHEQQRAQQLQQQVDALRGSTIWRLTGPLRGLLDSRRRC